MTRFLLLGALLCSLSSCNTLIGVGRDTRQAFSWTKDKMQSNGGGSGAPQSGGTAQGAPVY